MSKDRYFADSAGLTALLELSPEDRAAVFFEFMERTHEAGADSPARLEFRRTADEFSTLSGAASPVNEEMDEELLKGSMNAAQIIAYFMSWLTHNPRPATVKKFLERTWVTAVLSNTDDRLHRVTVEAAQLVIAYTALRFWRQDAALSAYCGKYVREYPVLHPWFSAFVHSLGGRL